MEARQTRAIQDISLRLQQLSTVYEVSQTVTSTLEIHTVLDLIVSKAVEILNAQAGSLLLLDKDTNDLVFRVVSGPVSSSLLGQRLPPDEGIAGAAVRTGEGQIVNDVQVDPRWYAESDLATGFETQSILCVPLICRGRPIGALEVLNKLDGTSFNSADLELLFNFAVQAAVAVENAELYESEETQRRLQEFKGLHHISQAISSLTDIHQIYAQISERIAYLIGVEMCGVLLYNEEEQALVGQLPFFGIRDEVIGSYRIPVPDGGMAWQLLQEREYLILNDPQNESLLDEADLRELVQGAGLRETVFAPMVVGRRCIGMIQASNRLDGAPFTKDDAQFLCVFANQAAALVENALLFEMQQHQLRELGILFETSTAISSSLELEEVLATVARHMAYALNVSSCSISDWDPVRNVVTTLVAEASTADLAATLTTGDVGTSYSLADYPATAQVLRERRPLVVQVLDPDADPAERALLTEMGQESVLLMPLETRDRVVGLLELYESRHAREFSIDDIRLCRALANQAAIAIDNARLYAQTDEQLRARVDELTALQRTMEELNATLELERILQVVLDSAVQTTQATQGNVMLVDMNTSQLLLRAASGYSAEDESAIEQLLLHPSEESITFQVTQSGKAQIVDDATKESCLICVRDDTRSALAVPIFYQDAVVGLINLQNTKVSAFGQDDLTFVQALAEQAAIAIGNAMRYEEQVRVNSILGQRTEQLGALLAVSQKLRTDVPLEDTLEEVAYAVQETLGFNIVLISAVEDPQGPSPVLRRLAAAGLPLDVFEEAKRVRQPVERYERILSEEYRQGECYFFPFQKQDEWAADLHTLVPMTEIEGWVTFR
jgi:GAF domain-containing protein